MAIIIHIFIGWGFLRLVNLSIGPLKNNGYMALLVALLIMAPVIFIAADFARLHPGEDMPSLFRQAFGKLIGSFLTLSILVWLFFILVFIIRESHLMVVTYFFKQTPLPLMIFFFCGICLYLALHGLRACSRLAAFVLIPPLIIIYGLLLLGLYNINPLNIRPVLSGLPWQWLTGGWDLVFVVVPTGAVMFYLPFIEQPQPGRVRRIVLKSLAVIAPLFFASILGAIGTFGARVIPKMAWPAVEFFHVIEFPFLLLEQGGLLFLLAWYGFVVVSIGQGFFHLGYLAKRLVPPIPLHWCIMSLAILVFLTSILPSNTIDITKIVDHWRGGSNLFFLLLFTSTWVLLRLKAGRKGDKTS